jgi:hypothetical protein
LASFAVEVRQSRELDASGVRIDEGANEISRLTADLSLRGPQAIHHRFAAELPLC